MSVLGDFLKKSIEEMMDFHKRSATGEAVATLREEYKDGHLLIWGVDYWEEINNGVPAGTLVPISDLQNWSKAKSSRYSISLPASSAIQRRIFAKGARINDEKQRLQIINQVTEKNKDEILRLVQDFTFEQLKLR